MKKLHRYVLKAFIGPFLLTFGIAMIVLVLQFLWKWVDEMVGKGLEWSVIIELFFYTSISLIPLALILGVLLASIMSFGNLGEHNELTSMKASGVSLFSSMKPLFFLVGLLTLGAFAFSNYIIPVTNLKFYTLLYDIRRQRPDFIIKEGQFNSLEDISLKIGRKNRSNNIVYDVMIYDHSQKQGNISVMVADSADMNVTEDGRYLILKLFSGFSYAEQLEDGNKLDKDKKPLRRDYFDMQQVLFDLPANDFSRSREDTYKDHYKMLNMSQLADTAYALEDERAWRKKQAAQNILASHLMRHERKPEVAADPDYYPDSLPVVFADTLLSRLDLVEKQNAIRQAQAFARIVHSSLSTSHDTAQARQQWINRHRIEMHRKLTLSFACLVFFLIGAPLGAIIRKGGLGTPVVVSIVFFITWHIISLAGEKYAHGAVIPVWEGMWLSTILLIPLGIFLVIKATNDSALMSKETYTLLIERMLSFIHIRRKRENEDSANHQ